VELHFHIVYNVTKSGVDVTASGADVAASGADVTDCF
jgi:hypothetical protein